MKIYQFWSQKNLPVIENGQEKQIRFRAGSNESMEAAEQNVEQKIRKYRAFISAVENHTDFPDRPRQEEYAAPSVKSYAAELMNATLSPATGTEP